MFGFSISKILVLAVIVLAVWYGFRLFGRSANRMAPPDTGQSSHNGGIDTEYDPESDSYVPRDPKER